MHNVRRFGGGGLTFIDFLDVDHTETVTLSQAIQISSEEVPPSQDTENEANVSFGYIQGTVVGLRYYTGVVNRGEMVSLVREPQNPYDRNAVMVANVYGRQVGHIKKELAAAMAPIMDGNLAKIEGVVPYGETNKFSMPVILSFWGKEESRNEVIKILARHRFSLGSGTGGKGWGKYGESAQGSIPSSKRLNTIPLTPEQLKSTFDKLFDDLMENKTREMEPAKAISTPLLPHQKQALQWMTSRENSNDLPPFWEHKSGIYFNILTNFAVKERPERVLGGILADDMGLGKTLTTIALIVSNFRDGKPLPLEKMDTSAKHSSRTEQPKRGHKEIIQFEDSEAQQIDREAGVPKKKAKKSDEAGASSSTGKHVLIDDMRFASALAGPSEESSKKHRGKKKNSGGKSKDCESSSGSSSHARATLILCPLSVLSNWLDQFEQHVQLDVKLNVYLYYGAERNRDKDFLAGQDVVLSTYNVLSSDFSSKGSSPLHKINWLRVVLDEGHNIRNPNALQSKAALELMAERRWILSGTPIQNSLKDLWTLLSFLKLKPFDVREWWNRVIQRPVTQGDPEGVQNLQALVKAITLRRTKTSKFAGRPVVELPERKVLIQPITLTEEERQEYDLAKMEGKNIIGRYVKEGTVLTNYADVLAILVRLRQMCCHPALLGSYAGTGDASTPSELRERLVSKIRLVLGSGSDEECAICLDSLRQPVITYCAHVFCRLCICEVIRSEQEHAKCPLCRAEIRTRELVEYPGEEEDVLSADAKDKWRSSSKVEALMSRLLALRSEDASVKSLVVSQFTRFLTLLEVPLREHGFTFTRLDGSMSQRNRAKAIQEFQDESAGGPSIMLLSLKAGGVGLNLTAASYVFLMDPAWNPAAEDQCVDRCHRLGQKRDVVITKFIVTDSVEENMVKIQRKKLDLVEKALGAKNIQEKRQSRIADIRALMEL